MTAYPTPQDQRFDQMLIDFERRMKIAEARLDQLTPSSPTVWTIYTPTFSGTLGNGTVYGAYSKVGTQVTVRANLVWGSTTSGTRGFSLPFTAATVSGPPAATPIWVGGTLVWTAAGNNQAGWSYINSAGTAVLTSSDTAGGAWTGTIPQTFASGDKFGSSITYESIS